MSLSPSTSPPSAAEECELILPGYIRRETGRVVVDPAQFPSKQEFERIIDRIFAAGFFLRGLDYPVFQSLLYGKHCPVSSAGIFLAQEIAVFAPERQSLYHPLKITEDQAEYLFEPVALERPYEVPLFETGEDGQDIQVGVEQRMERIPTELDLDEFVAHCWKNGVRFGIDCKRVRELLQVKHPERAVIARSLPPTEGKDAGIAEQTKALHRSDAPSLLPDGRVDLSHYANRFPQIHKGTLLLMKTPRQLGEMGRRLDGQPIEPRLPNDFDIQTLAGEGTHIERYEEREYLVASISGFLDIDAQTNRISVMEKIINREGVSTRTTGDLILEGDQYEEYGEVQEGRNVEGKNLVFHADVFGRVSSTGGNILIDSNLSGGMALNRNGDIEVRGMVSNAVLRSAHGAIRAQRVENSVLVADYVEIESAVQCTILAEVIVLGTAAGCTIGGKRVSIGELRDHGPDDTMISMLMPDLKGFERLQAEERKYLAECEQVNTRLQQNLCTMTNEPEVQQYLVLAGKLQRKEITLSPQQKVKFQQLAAHLAPTLKRIKQTRDDYAAMQLEISGVHERIDKIEEQTRKASDGIGCHLDKVQGVVRVRPLVVLLDAPPLQRMSPRDLRVHLRNSVAGEKMLFSGNASRVSWQHQTTTEHTA